MRAIRLVVLSCLLGVTSVLPGAGGPLLAGAIWLVCLVLLARAHPNGLMSFACLYLLLLGLFHLGFVVPWAVGLLPGPHPEWLSSPWLGTALGLFASATLAFALGATLGETSSPDRAVPFADPSAQLFRLGKWVALLGAGMLWLGVWKLKLMTSGYDVYFERALTEDVRFFGFGLMLFPLGVLVAAIGATPAQMSGIGLAFTIVLGPLFLAGFRGPTLVQFIALLAVWAHKDLRSARRVAAAGLLVATALVPVIRMSRNIEDKTSQRAVRFEPMAVVEEAGGSFYPLMVTVESVASGAEPLWMGRSYLTGLGRILPNVSIRWSAPKTFTLSPSAWATRQADPWAYEHGGGIGFSGVAEPYLNFGLPGVVTIFLLLGYVVARCDGWLRSEPIRATIGAASFGSLLWTVRNDSVELFRVFVISALIALVAWGMTRTARTEATGHALS